MAATVKPSEAQEAVLKYLKEHQVTEKLNTMINKLSKCKPDDPWGFLCTELTREQRPRITEVHARQIFDSRGNPTVEVEVHTLHGVYRASVPSGASTGIYEACELRDKGADYHGKGVRTAVNHVNTVIAPKIIGLDPRDQRAIDTLMVEELDGTKGEHGWTKSKLGANAILGVSLAVCRAGAGALAMPLYQYIANLAGIREVRLPVPAFNIINGGAHAGNNLPMQEFMILPIGAGSFSEAMKMGSEVYHHLHLLIKKRYGQDATNVGDEGGFAPPLGNAKDALDLIQEAILLAKCEGKVFIGMDIAASEFYKDNKYDLKVKDKNRTEGEGVVSGEELLEIYKSFLKDYPLVTLEDPFAQDDWESWTNITAQMGGPVQIVGDDLLVTNISRVKTAVSSKACNALLLKVNQIGTVSESIDAVLAAKKAGWGIMASHRSGETEDTFIADLAVGLSTGQIKSGAPCRSERLAKYNQLLRIEEEMGKNAKYAGTQWREVER